LSWNAATFSAAPPSRKEIIPLLFSNVLTLSHSCARKSFVNSISRRHGLEISPLDGTFSHAQWADYLWRVNDHAKSIRDIRPPSAWTPRPTTNFPK